MRRVASPACRFCESRDTIRTDQTLAYESWYCYSCRRGFDVHQVAQLTTEPQQRGYRPAVLRQFTSRPQAHER